MLKIIIVLVVGYLLGSISSGVIVSKAFSNTDIRSQGSGNAGTTNMLRVLGRKLALITFAGDLLKGVIAVLIGKAIVGGDLGGVLGVTGAVLGHYFPLYFGFKGGKGIATGFGSLLFVFPVEALCALAVFVVIVAITRYVSLGSVVAAAVLPVLVFVTHGENTAVCIITALVALSAIWRHGANICRLLSHTESKLDLSKLKGKKK